jgi:3-keto-disaccharide hydrolase
VTNQPFDPPLTARCDDLGRWNLEEVTCRDGTISCKINGIEVSSGTGEAPVHGQIGWQSEGAPIRFRDSKIKVLD